MEIHFMQSTSMDIHGFFLQNNQNSFMKKRNLWKHRKFMESIGHMEIYGNFGSAWKFLEIIEIDKNYRKVCKLMEVMENFFTSSDPHHGIYRHILTF